MNLNPTQTNGIAPDTPEGFLMPAEMAAKKMDALDIIDARTCAMARLSALVNSMELEFHSPGPNANIDKNLLWCVSGLVSQLNYLENVNSLIRENSKIAAFPG